MGGGVELLAGAVVLGFRAVEKRRAASAARRTVAGSTRRWQARGEECHWPVWAEAQRWRRRCKGA